jgi:hypothetical protein
MHDGRRFGAMSTTATMCAKEQQAVIEQTLAAQDTAYIGTS